MQTSKEQFVVQPIPGCPPAIGAALWRMEEARKRTFEQLGNVPEAMIDFASEHERHTVGTLLYHIALIEADWLYAEVLVTDYAPDIVALFPYDVRLASGRLTPVFGEKLATHLNRLTVVRARLIETFTAMSLDDYYRPRSLERYDVTPEWVLFHLSQHEAEHRAELNSLRQRFEVVNTQAE